MASPLSFTGSPDPHPTVREPTVLVPSAVEATVLEHDDLSQPLRRIDQAHQWLEDLDHSSVGHRESICSPTPGPAGSLAKESPTARTVAEVSPPIYRHEGQANDSDLPNAADTFGAIRSATLGFGSAWSPEQMLQAHATDLISFLQNWSDDLDQRSAKLNADIAAQERRERSFRMWMQQRRAEIEAASQTQQQQQMVRQAAARREYFQASEGGVSF